MKTVDPKFLKLCRDICSIGASCVMEEHPERPACDRSHCHTVQVVEDLIMRLARPVSEAQIQSFTHDPIAWSRDQKIQAIQAVIPYLLDEADER